MAGDASSALAMGQAPATEALTRRCPIAGRHGTAARREGGFRDTASSGELRPEAAPSTVPITNGDRQGSQQERYEAGAARDRAEKPSSGQQCFRATLSRTPLRGLRFVLSRLRILYLHQASAWAVSDAAVLLTSSCCPEHGLGGATGSLPAAELGPDRFS